MICMQTISGEIDLYKPSVKCVVIHVLTLNKCLGKKAIVVLQQLSPSLQQNIWQTHFLLAFLSKRTLFLPLIVRDRFRSSGLVSLDDTMNVVVVTWLDNTMNVALSLTVISSNGLLSWILSEYFHYMYCNYVWKEANQCYNKSKQSAEASVRKQIT